jgi:hypothetical protein
MDALRSIVEVARLEEWDKTLCKEVINAYFQDFQDLDVTDSASARTGRGFRRP